MNSRQPTLQKEIGLIALLLFVLSILNSLSIAQAAERITVTGKSAISINGVYQDIQGRDWLTGRLYEVHSGTGMSSKPIEILFYSLDTDSPLSAQVITSNLGTFEVLAPPKDIKKATFFFRKEPFYTSSASTFSFEKIEPPSALNKTNANGFYRLLLLSSGVGLLILFLVSALINVARKTSKPPLLQPHRNVATDSHKNVEGKRTPSVAITSPRSNVITIMPYCKISSNPLSNVKISIQAISSTKRMPLPPQLDGRLTLNASLRGKHTIHAEKPGFAPTTIEVDLAKATSPIKIGLDSFKLQAMASYLKFLQENALSIDKTPLQIKESQETSPHVTRASIDIQDIAFGGNEFDYDRLEEFKASLKRPS